MQYLKECAEKLNISITDSQLDQFEKYYDILIETNKVMNLTAITQREEVIQKHFLDSIAVLQYIDLSDQRVIDIGTGAGFPGIPLKILRPELHLTLLDSLNKRIHFLNEVSRKCQLTNLKMIHGRAEDYAHQKEFREQYDFVFSRAVANLSTLSEYCLPFVRLGGMFISYKSGNIEEELEHSKNAIFLCGGKCNRVQKFSLTPDVDRSFIFIEKKRATAKKFPRKAGTPSKSPL